MPVKMSSAVIIGANGGIGRALCDALASDPRYGQLYKLSRDGEGIAYDPLDEARIATALSAVEEPVSLAMITIGMLHDSIQSPEKSWRDLNADRLARSFAINTIAPAIIAKHLIPKLPRKAPARLAFLSARVGSISDNRTGGWHGYRASKAALNMMVKTIAIELRRTHPEAICVALHPGTVDTAMSKPFQANVAPEKLFEPAFAAQALLGVVHGLTPAESGGHFAWDGTPIPA